MTDLCPKCGTPFAEDDNYCRTCRHQRKAVQPPPRNGSNPTTIVLIVLLAVACMVIGVLAGALLVAPQGDDEDSDAGKIDIPTSNPTEDKTVVSTPVADTNSFAPTSKDQQLSTPVVTPSTPSTPSYTTTVTYPVVTPSTPSTPSDLLRQRIQW